MQELKLRHLPLEVIEDKERDILIIEQKWALNGAQGALAIELDPEQAIELERLLRACNRARKASTAVPEERTGAPLSFDAWWESYPANRRVDKSTCKRLWIQKALDDKADAVLNHTIKMAQSQDWIKEEGRYCPLSVTYLRQDRYETGEAAPSWQPKIL